MNDTSFYLDERIPFRNGNCPLFTINDKESGTGIKKKYPALVGVAETPAAILKDYTHLPKAQETWRILNSLPDLMHN